MESIQKEIQDLKEEIVKIRFELKEREKRLSKLQNHVQQLCNHEWKKEIGYAGESSSYICYKCGMYN